MTFDREGARHPEAAAKRPSKDRAPSPFEARCRAHLRVTIWLEIDR
jgi:hypothetical protein